MVISVISSPSCVCFVSWGCVVLEGREGGYGSEFGFLGDGYRYVVFLE